MSYITRNANLVLLIMITLSAAGLVGATIYFQNNFKKINNDYSAKLTQLNKIKEDLDQQQKLLDSVKQELQLKSSREQQFSEKFTEVRGEKDQLDERITSLTKKSQNLETDLGNTRADLQKKIKENSDLSQKNVKLDDDLKMLTIDKANLNNQITQVRSEKESLQGRLNQCLNPGR